MLKASGHVYLVLPFSITNWHVLFNAQNGIDSGPVKFWKLYESEADKHDSILTGTWKEDTGAIVIFVRPLHQQSQGL
jgi:hypothetical protein